MVGQGVVRFPDVTLAVHPSRGFPTKRKKYKMTKALPQVPFENSYLYATIETGKSPSEDRPASLGLIISDNAAATLVQIKAGGLCIYADVATARSLATQIIRLTDDGDLLWDTEPMTGEEVDRWTEDIRAGAIGGDPS